MSEEEMRTLGYQVVDYIVAHRSRLRDKKVFNMLNYEALRTMVPSALPQMGESPEQVLAELESLLNQSITHTDHPRFFAFIPSPSNYLSVLAQTLASGYNVFAGHWMAGSGAAMIETITIRWLCQLMDYPEGSGGIFLSGGSMANLQALATARHIKLGDNFAKGRVYYSEQTHSSLAKGLRILGFAPEQMCQIRVNSSMQMDLPDLSQQIKQDRERGYLPFCIVANAGTTNTGAVDHLPALAQMAQDQNMWFHIDGAYGAVAKLSEAYRGELQGLELADSITLDPHKWWFQPYETGCLLVKNKLHLKETFQVQAEYLDDTLREEEEINYYDYGVQLTRSFRAIKLYAFLKTKGIKALSQEITQGIRFAEYVHERLIRKPYWESIHPPSLGILAFRVKWYEDEPSNDQFNKALSEHILADGYAFITTSKIRGRMVLRMCPINPRLQTGELDETINRMEKYIESNAPYK